MASHQAKIASIYAFAAVLLSVYGTEVCPYVEGLGLVGVSPVFALSFLVAAAIRPTIMGKFASNPSSGLKLELMLWTLVGLFLSVFNLVVHEFPLASGLKVTVGCIALGLPVACYYGLKLEGDEILLAQSQPHRARPDGPSRSIPTHLYRFLVLSQVLLAAVIVLLVFKDLSHIENAQNDDLKALVLMIAIEVVGAFVVLLLANALVAWTYAKNLKRLLNQQLHQMDAVANGDLSALVPVVSNDEMAKIGDRTNSMIASLRERDHIKSIFGKLVSPEVAKHLLESTDADALGGREIEAVVLFTDIRGFTSLSEVCTAPQVVSLLNEYFSMLVEIIHDEGGVLDKFIGDAAMAVFGLNPEINACDANESAVNAAFRIREQLATVNASLQTRGLPSIDNGFGIHYGKMVAGNIGSEDRLEYTVIGDAVNVASRLEGLCKTTKNWLSVSSISYDHLTPVGQERLTPLGDHAMKGKTSSMLIYGAQALEGQAT